MKIGIEYKESITGNPYMLCFHLKESPNRGFFYGFYFINESWKLHELNIDYYFSKNRIHFAVGDSWGVVNREEL
jgi:hypothetical protein